jgi:pyridoxamine 5'-phosphate oxidase family protein
LGESQFGRLATLGKQGDLQVLPVAFRYYPDQDAIDIGGHNLVHTKKYRDALRHGRVAFVVDDLLPPWQPRLIEVRGAVTALPEGWHAINANFAPAILRITPTYIVSMGIADDVVRPAEGLVHIHSRKFPA